MRNYILSVSTALLAACATPYGETESESGTISATDASTGSITTGMTGTTSTTSTTSTTGMTSTTSTTDSGSGSSTTSADPCNSDGICDPDENVDNCPDDCNECGDGKKTGTEECDDDNNVDSDDCTNTCNSAKCGDGIAWTLGAGLETCDDSGLQTADCETNCIKPNCGDGILNAPAGEDCDDHNTIKNDGCSDVCKVECVAFVTNGIFNGSLGGLAGGDAKCSSAASSAGLHGIYRAWLSDSKVSAINRLAACTVPVTLLNGTIISNSWADFTTPDHKEPIAVDEYDSAPEVTDPQFKVWTGTLKDGSAAVLNCMDWSSAMVADIGRNGSSAAKNSSWTEDGLHECNRKFHLYCIQQPD